MEITLEQLTHGNYSHALEINRDDIPEAWVDNAAYLMDLTDYGEEHHLIGHTYLARLGTRYIGIILIGEAIPWDTDPDEIRGRQELQKQRHWRGNSGKSGQTGIR